MRALIRFLARLYPPGWRGGYGVEFTALLEDVELDWRTPLDIVKGALEMRMRTWNLAAILATTGLIGAVSKSGRRVDPENRRLFLARVVPSVGSLAIEVKAVAA